MSPDPNMVNVLSDEFAAGFAAGQHEGWEEGWKSGWLQRGAELVAIVSAADDKDFTPTMRAGVMKAYQRQVAALEGGAQ